MPDAGAATLDDDPGAVDWKLMKNGDEVSYPPELETPTLQKEALTPAPVTIAFAPLSGEPPSAASAGHEDPPGFFVHAASAASGRSNDATKKRRRRRGREGVGIRVSVSGVQGT